MPRLIGARADNPSRVAALPTKASPEMHPVSLTVADRACYLPLSSTLARTVRYADWGSSWVVQRPREGRCLIGCIMPYEISEDSLHLILVHAFDADNKEARMVLETGTHAVGLHRCSLPRLVCRQVPPMFVPATWGQFQPPTKGGWRGKLQKAIYSPTNRSKQNELIKMPAQRPPQQRRQRNKNRLRLTPGRLPASLPHHWEA